MITIRKADFYLQVTLFILMMLLLAFFIIYGFLAGLFLIGAWQLFSAATNTPAFIANGLLKEISRYWMATGLIMGTLFLCVPLGQFFNTDDVQVIGCIGIIPAAPLAAYYLIIYKKLIFELNLKQEVSGLVKSKH